MGGLSIWHIIVLIVFVVVFVIPAWKILNRAGFSGWWGLLWLVPFLNIVFLWVFAFVPWPAVTTKST